MTSPYFAQARFIQTRRLAPLLLTLVVLAPRAGGAQAVPQLPGAVTNNAVASGQIGNTWWIFSALGVDSTKRWSGITRRAAAWSSQSREWRLLPEVPGTRGRLAATAQVVRGRLIVFGGYTVDSAAAEQSLPNVDIYDPRTNRWERGTDIPVAVDDAVSGVVGDSLVYLVSGWHDTDNVRDVQVYDVVRDRWFAASPIPGPGVFGHTGAIAGRTIVFVDGAIRQPGAVKYRLEPQVWIGTIDANNPARIAWRAGGAHPGAPLYRAAAAACGDAVILAGGTGNPYNYNGIGYDGAPSSPLATVWSYDTRTGRWHTLASMPAATMDHRALAVVGDAGWVVGGMRAGRQVSSGSIPVAIGRCRP